jgi:hypothetical protein
MLIALYIIIVWFCLGVLSYFANKCILYKYFHDYDVVCTKQDWRTQHQKVTILLSFIAPILSVIAAFDVFYVEQKNKDSL